MASTAPELSVVVLCYRAERLLYRVVDPIYALLEGMGVPYELVLVANAWDADDPTPALADEWARTRPTAVVVARRKDGHAGWDLRTGLHAARGAHLVYLDGDGQVATEDVGTAYRLLVASGADVVKGRRTTRADGRVRALTSFVYNTAFRVLFGTWGLWDVNGQPKALTRAAYERLELVSDDWFIEAEVVLRARELGLEVLEFPTHFSGNVDRVSLVGWGTVWEFVANMLRWRLGRHPAQRNRRRPPGQPVPLRTRR